MRRIADNIRQILEQIDEFEQRYQRSEGSVSLLAVSKKQPENRIREAYEAGIRDFGENYLQDAEGKINALCDLAINWHFIGPLQSNKTKAVAALFQWVHSIDRLKIAHLLNDHRGDSQPPLNVCVQVNLAREASKSGVDLSAANQLCDQVAELPHLKLRGLMTIPAVKTDFEQQRDQFHRLSALFHSLKSRYPFFDTLSMGMSNDFEAAIAEGSTMVRLGTALFGPRI